MLATKVSKLLLRTHQLKLLSAVLGDDWSQARQVTEVPNDKPQGLVELMDLARARPPTRDYVGFKAQFQTWMKFLLGHFANKPNADVFSSRLCEVEIWLSSMYEVLWTMKRPSLESFIMEGFHSEEWLENETGCSVLTRDKSRIRMYVEPFLTISGPPNVKTHLDSRALKGAWCSWIENEWRADPRAMLPPRCRNCDSELRCLLYRISDNPKQVNYSSWFKKIYNITILSSTHLYNE